MKAWRSIGRSGLRIAPDALGRLAGAAALDARFRAHLRLVGVEDAAFIYGLRCDAKLGRYISPPPPDVAAQRGWIEHYKEREANGEELYFIICCDGRDMGTARMYDFRRIGELRSFGWGSWIVKAPHPPTLVLFSAIMIYELGLETLDFDQSHFEVAHDNPSLSMHAPMGARREGEREGFVMFSLSPDALRALKLRHARLMTRYRGQPLEAGAADANLG
jgi:hypothetical protein